MSLITRFLRDDSGATAIEYGLIAAGISVAIIATVTQHWSQARYDLRQGRYRIELAGVAP